MGQKQKALEYYNQSLLLSNSIQDRHTEARTLNNIGSVYSSLGEKQKALEAYSQALLVYQALEDRPGEAITLDNIGGVYIFLNENQKAFDFFDQALSLFRAIKDPRGEATTLVNIGYSYSSIGSNQKALDYYLSALPLYKIVQDPRGEATVLNNIGTIYESLGSQEKALDYFSDALPIFQAIGDRQGEANTLKNLGETTSAQNRPQLAIFLLKQSVNTVQSLRKDIDKLPKSIQRTYAKSQSESYRILAKYLLEQGRILEAEQVLDLLKIEELDDYFKGNFRGNKIQRNVDYLRPEQEILNLYNSHQQSAVVLGQELSKLENLSKSGVSLTPAQEKRKAELDSLLTDIKSQFNKFIYSPEVQKLTDQLTRADQQQISLDVFDKLRTNLRLSHSKAVLIYPLILDDRLEMIITTPDTPPLRRVVNVKRAELLKAIVDYRDILRNPSLDAKPLAKKLYAWLIAPLETDLVAANAKTILYAPDGPLRYIPLAALYDGTQWLAQKYAVNNITSVSISDLNARPRPILKVLAGAFADKNLIYKIQVGQQPPFSLHGLPFAGQEVEAVAATVSNTNKLVDQAFSLRATKPRFREYNILHFATHYLFFPGKPEESFLLFGDGERASLGSINDWSLSNVDLVVLSGCETGVGIDAFSQKPNPDKSKLGNGIEFLGLGYQFQASGAGAVIASLWPVNDGGTERLMSAFYTSLSKDNTKAEALRQAQVALITGQFKSQAGINNLSHPYYWAPFFLIGNGL